jgi:rhamnosyltransferase
MIISNIEKIKRLVIFFFYDKDGIVDDYIPFMLNDINNNSSELLVVCNGKLNEEGKNKLKKLTNNILIRENKGFDVWAYKAGLEHYGWEKLTEFDEIVLMNFTIMGPLYPFKEMFDTMNKKNVDFWGITIHHGAPFDPFGKIEYGFLPLHLQSHFLAIRNDMIKSNDFHLYWTNRPMINTYEEAICLHEAIFTKKFENLGFIWDVYIDTRDLIGHSYYPLFTSSLELVKNRKCPIIKRKNFFCSYNNFLDFTNGEASIELFEFIKENLSYDINMIFDNILRTENQADIKDCLHFNYILPSIIKQNSNLNLSDKKIALVMHIFYEELIEYCFKYAISIPKTCHVYITTDSQKKKEVIETIFSKNSWNKFEVILIENKGRDVSAFLVGTKDFIMEYDYVCFVHDKKVPQLYLTIKGESFSYKCFENLLKNEIFVENVIDTFENNSRLGLLVPPPPNFADFFPTISSSGSWRDNFENTKKLANQLGINVNFDKEKEPIAPLGTMFWFRPKAMKTLFDVNWKYKDFPVEPNANDGTILHSIERIYPFVVQHEGYYPAWLMVDTFARIEITNLYYMLSEINKFLFFIYGYNTHYGLLNAIKNKLNEDPQVINYSLNDLFKKLLKEKIKKTLPKPLFNFLKKIYRKNK